MLSTINDSSDINKEIVDEWSSIYSLIQSDLISNFHNVINSADFKSNTEIYFEKLKSIDVIDWHKAYIADQEKNKLLGHNFNIFDILSNELGFKIRETMHSKLIKYLLDIKGSHGLGDLFLIEFLKYIGITEPETGTWHVTAEMDKIDILLHRNFPQSVIIIENKSNWASDGQNQLYRYWYKSIYLKTKETDCKFYEQKSNQYQIIYLTPNKNKQYSQQSIFKPNKGNTSSYEKLPEIIPMNIKTFTFDDQIQIWLEKCKSKIPETNHRVREYIAQYQMLCKKL